MKEVDKIVQFLRLYKEGTNLLKQAEKLMKEGCDLQEKSHHLLWDGEASPGEQMYDNGGFLCVQSVRQERAGLWLLRNAEKLFPEGFRFLSAPRAK